MSVMESLGEIDLNREISNGLLDLNCDNPNEISTSQKLVSGLGSESHDDSVINKGGIRNGLQKDVTEQPEDDPQLEEPEEGEISNDNNQIVGNQEENIGIHYTADNDECPMQKNDGDPSSSKASASNPFVRWPSGDTRKFYQRAWAQGVHGISKDPVGDSSLDDTASVRGKQFGEVDSPSVPVESSASWHENKGMNNSKGGWIIGDHGMEYVNFSRSDDGYIYLQNGGNRSGKGRVDKGNAERLSILNNSDDKYWSSTGKQVKYMKDRERRVEEQQFLPGNSNGWSGYYNAGHYIISDSLRDKLFAECDVLLSNITIKDAQKSFVTVCKHLRRLLKILRDLSKRLGPQFQQPEGYQRKLYAFTREALLGIRAAYDVVQGFGIGKEQEQDTDAFLRLLDLARNRCQSLFTPNQIQELDFLMMAVGSQNGNLGNYLSKAYTNSYESEKREQKEVESLCNASTTTQLESDSSTDVSANGGDEFQPQPNYAAEMRLSGVISANESIHMLDNNIAGSMGLGGWLSSSPEEHNEVQPYVSAKETTSSSIPLPCQTMDLQGGINQNTLSHVVGGMIDTGRVKFSEDAQALAGRNHEFPSHMDPIEALSSYHERFAGRSHLRYTRLPSPTPDVEDEDTTADGKISGTTVDSTEAQSARRESALSQDTLQNFQPSDFAPAESLFSSAKDTCGPSHAEDQEPEMNQTKLMSVKRSRDPRRRLGNQPTVLEFLQPAVENEGTEKLFNEANVPKQRNVPPKSELVSLLSLGMVGGWLSEPQLLSNVPGASSSTSTDSEALQRSVDSSTVSSQRKRQCEVLKQENPAKRHKFIEGAKEGDGFQTSPTTAFDDDAKQSFVDENVSLLRTQSKLPELTSGSMADASKLRMKPRDPRRMLLGSSTERSKVNEMLAVKGSVTPVSVTESNEIPCLKVEETAHTTTSSAAELKPVSPNKNDISHAVVDDGVNTSKPEDASTISKSIGGISTKAPAIKAESTSASSTAPKQKEMISHWDDLEPLLEGLEESQKRAVRQERARRIDEQTRMFAARKLCLVLDLDHTLLNSAKFVEVEEEWEAKLRANEMTERAKFTKEGNKRELYRFPHMGMWTKLRPGIWNFLARASQLYELHVYTMGNKAYATEMAKLLDPTGVLFAGRVISKGDDGDGIDGDDRPPKSKDLDGVLGMESAVVIIDDSVRVWPHHRHNLIVVERYMYFPCSRKQFGLPGPSLLEVGHDEREQDGMLASALMVIEKLHYSFFSNPRLHEVDVRDILAKEQRKVLAGCKLIFSRVFPQGEVQPHLHPLWQLAEQFGAVCSMAIDEGVTHVVAISLGTDKVNWGLTTGRFVVRPAWLEASAILYRRANERDFLVLP